MTAYPGCHEGRLTASAVADPTGSSSAPARAACYGRRCRALIDSLTRFGKSGCKNSNRPDARRPSEHGLRDVAGILGVVQHIASRRSVSDRDTRSANARRSPSQHLATSRPSASSFINTRQRANGWSRPPPSRRHGLGGHVGRSVRRCRVYVNGALPRPRASGSAAHQSGARNPIEPGTMWRRVQQPQCRPAASSRRSAAPRLPDPDFEHESSDQRRGKCNHADPHTHYINVSAMLRTRCRPHHPRSSSGFSTSAARSSRRRGSTSVSVSGRSTAQARARGDRDLVPRSSLCLTMLKSLDDETHWAAARHRAAPEGTMKRRSPRGSRSGGNSARRRSVVAARRRPARS